jgi:hypothetical protein
MLIAAHDPGSYLIPATCLFFRGTEGKDFVRGGGSRKFKELCWYTRASFRAHFPELQTLNATDTAARQVGRAGAALFVEKRATTDFVHKARLSLHLGLISLMLIAFAYYTARANARNI